jgi:hypothetical protein
MDLFILDQIRSNERFRATFTRRVRSTIPRAGKTRWMRKKKQARMFKSNSWVRTGRRCRDGGGEGFAIVRGRWSENLHIQVLGTVKAMALHVVWIDRGRTSDADQVG